ncbi:MAG: hypothetical protein ACRDTC_19745 [Pseudonocardiaceae bacterium]
MADLISFTEDEVFLGPDAPLSFPRTLSARCEGRTVISFDHRSSHRRNLELAAALLSSLGTVISVYPYDGCWSNLGVRIEANPARTHGTGENPLHVDLVDRTGMPRYIALYCMRDDVLGGGASALSDLWASVGDLTAQDHEVLSQPIFTYWHDRGVHGVGRSLDRFAILPDSIGPGATIRFTSKMYPHLRQGGLVEPGRCSTSTVVRAFGRLNDNVHAMRETYRLKPRQLLLFDQRRYAHGRMSLGEGQASVPHGSRRLLKQAYVAEGAGG